MNVLFLHNNFPGQYYYLATRLARNPNNTVVFGTKNREGWIKGVKKAYFEPHREPLPRIHPFARSFENNVLHGQAVFRMCRELKKEGFRPDIVCGHSGWGPPLFIKDAFPRAKQLTYFEWFFRSHGTDTDFLTEGKVEVNFALKTRVQNAPVLVDLASCDRGLSPMKWQREQFPAEWQSKIDVIHDGVESTFFKPLEKKPGLKLPQVDLDLSEVDEIITWVGRGMEAYRGFPQIMRAIDIVLRRRPKAHAVLVGKDRIAYGPQMPGSKGLKDDMLNELTDLPRDRCHFTGLLPREDYCKVLQHSSVHVYLTVPFVLSWSSMEAMSAGCPMVCSDTPPVREVMEDGENALLVDFFDHERLADRIEEVLDDRKLAARIGKNARDTIVGNYDVHDLLPKHVELMRDVIANG